MEPHSLALRARISAAEHYAYAVALEVPPGVSAEQEAFRFGLHYYARVSRHLVRHERSVRELPRWIERISAAPLSYDSSIFAITSVPATLARSLTSSHLSIILEMRTYGLRDRELTGELAPLRGTLLAVSVLAVWQAILPYLSAASLAAFPAALANMQASYELTHSYSDAASEREVPALAFRAAAFV